MKKFGWVCDRLVEDLVEGVGRIRYELTKKDFRVGVKCDDDQTHRLLNVGIERESPMVSILTPREDSMRTTLAQKRSQCQSLDLM